MNDLNQRLQPGARVPSGECEECGALCYPVKPFGELTVVFEEDGAAVAARVEMINGRLVVRVINRDGFRKAEVTIGLEEGGLVVYTPARSPDSPDRAHTFLTKRQVAEVAMKERDENG